MSLSPYRRCISLPNLGAGYEPVTLSSNAEVGDYFMAWAEDFEDVAVEKQRMVHRMTAKRCREWLGRNF